MLVVAPRASFLMLMRVLMRVIMRVLGVGWLFFSAEKRSDLHRRYQGKGS
jgi:hypothetical protein